MSVLLHASGPVPDAWLRSPIPVIVGFAPPDTIRLDDLADPRVVERLMDTDPAVTGGDLEARRAAALALIHHCLRVVEISLTAPLVLDGMALDCRPTQLGVRIRDGVPAAIWIAGVRLTRATDPALHLGAAAYGLLVPIVAAIQGVVRLPSRGVDNVMLDGLAAGYRRCARLAGREPDPAFVARLMAGAGRPEHRVARPLAIRVDDGPPVTFHAPASCCVLARTAAEGSCPTCPQWSDDAARGDAIRAWVAAMDDGDFRATTGRARLARTRRSVPCTPPSGVPR